MKFIPYLGIVKFTALAQRRDPWPTVAAAMCHTLGVPVWRLAA
jgi:hypothetical protein